ncbi:MAG: flagellar basal-body MS-ring/collar protein FliF, partial [Oscillospiraceae bacterium]
MGEKLKKISEPLLNAWNKLSKVMKIALVASVAFVLIFALGATFFVNKTNASYMVLFPGMSTSESMEVFAALQSREIPVRRTAAGEVTVPEERIGEAMLEMAVLGYPKTTMPFDTFSSNSGFTTTEFEKKQYLLFNLQERMEGIIGNMTGVKNVSVTITVPQENNYAWNEQTGVSTASITLTMLPGYSFSPEKVAALKSLLATSVPRMSPENVSVIDGETMIEMESSSQTGDKYGLDRLGFEAEIEKRIESKIKKVLSLGYAPGDIMVSATVVIDYDKMITENLQYIPEADGNGIKGTVDERYTNEGTSTASGIPGEELNTDTPIYEAKPADGTNYADYQRKIDYLVSQMKSQIEKDYAKLKYATVAITVKDNELTEDKQAALIETASKAANIPVENISLNNFLVSTQLPDKVGAGTPAW